MPYGLGVFPAFLVGVDIVMVGDGHGGEALLEAMIDELPDRQGAIGKGGMHMQIHELRGPVLGLPNLVCEFARFHGRSLSVL